MTTLHLGVVDVPYGNEDPARPGRPAAKTPNETTGDVAQILEDKYHVIEIFWALHGQEVADKLVEGLQGSIESVLMGAPATINPHGTAEAFAMQLFDKFITMKEMDGLGYPGVPTKASLDGVSHRFKNKKGFPGRPSFLDTGLFLQSFRAWVEGQTS